MARYTITNNALGARGAGNALVEAGETVELELSDEVALLFSGFDDVELTETDKPKRGRPAKDAE